MNIDLVVKASKFCNLRCTYCYETPELAIKERMALENIERMFVHIRDFVWKWEGKSGPEITFYWQGGEPFVQPVQYWESILDAQRNVFGAAYQQKHVRNAIQSNLTLVTEKHLPLFRDYALGFSYDVVNDLRVNTGGQQTGEIVRRKIDWLISQGVKMIGGVAVISKVNVEYVTEIADFFLSRGLGFRASNIYKALDFPQVENVAASWDDYLEFFVALLRLPQVRSALAKGIAIEPISTALKQLDDHLNGAEMPITEDESVQREWVWSVNTNGDIHSVGDLYNPELKYGNIFDQTMEQLLDSSGRQKRIERSRERVSKICSNCFLYRKGCSGAYISHCTREETKAFEELKTCYYGYLAGVMKNEIGHTAGSAA